MEGELTHQGVEERREGHSEAASAASASEGSRENTVVCEGVLKPQFSPCDSILTDSGVSEMTNTESDYSDSLEQDDEEANTPPEGGQAEAEVTRASLTPSSNTEGEMAGFEEPGDASWFDQDTSDFFIDANLTQDNGIVEFDPNNEDFTNWDSVKSFFEGLIERQNTELDRIGGLDYEPEAQDCYTVCRTLSAEEDEKKENVGFRLFERDEECLLDTDHLVGPFPADQRFVMRGASGLPAPKVINYNYEMLDESWGHSSHEPYFDVVTGQRILSTIYEFEVSSDEDTESVKVVDASWHEMEPATTGRQGEGGKEGMPDENISGKETKQNEEIVMRRGKAGGSHSSSAANVWSGDGETPEDIASPHHHTPALPYPTQAEGREEDSAGIEKDKSVTNISEVSETDTQVLHIMTETREHLISSQSETPNRLYEGETKNDNQGYGNLVNLDNTLQIPPGQSVCARDSTLTGHTLDDLGVLHPTTDPETKPRGGGDEGEAGCGKDKETNSAYCDTETQSAIRIQETSIRIASEDPKTRPDTTGTQKHTAPRPKRNISITLVVDDKASLRKNSGDKKDGMITHTNKADTSINSPSVADGDTNTSLSVVSPAHQTLADIPHKQTFNMQQKEEDKTKNIKGDDEATLTQDPFTSLSPKHLKKEDNEERPDELPNPPLNVLTSESHTEGEHTNKHEYSIETDDGESSDVTSITMTRDPEAPPRPSRRTYTLNTIETCHAASSSPLKGDDSEMSVSGECVGVSGQCVGVSGECVGVLECVSPQEDGGRVVGVSGSFQGHPDVSTQGGDGREFLEEEEEEEEEEEMVVLEKSTVTSSLIHEVEEEEKEKENKKELEEKTEGEGYVLSIPTLTEVTIPVQQQEQEQEQEQEQQVATTTTTTFTTTSTEADITLLTEAKVFNEGVDKDTHDHHQHNHAHTHPLDLTSTTSTTNTTTVTSNTTTTTSTVTSPLKPKRSSRTDLKKPKSNHTHALQSETESPPSKPVRRKHKNTATHRRQEETKKNMDKIKPETGTPQLKETHLNDTKREEEGGQQGTDTTLEKVNVNSDGNESTSSWLEASATELQKGQEGRSDSRLEREGIIYHDDRLDGGEGEGEGERERGSDSGSGSEGGEGDGEAVQGRGSDTFGTLAVPFSHTNNPDGAAGGEPAGECDNSGDDCGITGVVREEQELHLQETDEPVFESLSEPREVTLTEHYLERREASDEKTENDLTLVPTKSHNDSSKDEHPQTSTPETGSTEGQVAPPRRRRRASSSLSLNLEDARADQDTGQTPQTTPIVPVRRKRQFSSLPRPPKTKTYPQDAPRSLTTSALPLASPTHQASALKSVSTQNDHEPETQDVCSFPERNGTASGNRGRRKTVEFESEVEIWGDRPRRLSDDPTKEKKRNSLGRSLKRTRSLKNKFYNKIQTKFDKNPHGEAEGGAKMKYFSRIFHRKQKLYDMNGPSQHHSEIPAPAPPPPHLTSENTETFATLWSSYFLPDTDEHSKSNGDTKSKYTTLERTSSHPNTEKHEERTILKKTQQQDHLTPTTDNSETTILLQDSLASSKASVESLNQGNSNEGFEQDETEPHVQDAPLEGDSDDEHRCQRVSVSDSEEACPSPVITTEAQHNPEERLDNCSPQPKQNTEELEPPKNTTEDALEVTVNTEHQETPPPDDTQTLEEPKNHLDLEEDWELLLQHCDHFLTAGEHNTTHATPTTLPSLPPPPHPPADEEGRGLEEVRQAVYTWERPAVSLRTWAERQGIETLTLPPLHLREYQHQDLDAMDYYYDSDSSLERDTPSPGPPVDSEKEGQQGQQALLNKQKREEDRTQKDRCVEVYPETVRQRQRNMMATNNSNKVDIKNWSSSNNNNNDTQSSPAKSKKFLPSVKALRNQFEAGKTSNGKTEANGSITTNDTNGHAQTLNRKSSSSSVTSNAQDKASITTTNTNTNTTISLHSPNASVESLGSPAVQDDTQGSNEPVEPIFNQFRKVDQELKELMSKPHSTSGWDPRPLLRRLYYIPEAPKMQSQGTTYVNIEGYLEKLPSGRKKATFWNAWKRRYFMAKNGILYYYQSAQTDKASMKMTLMGGKVECMEPNMVGVDDGSRDTKASNMLGIDDGKGHYVVVRCSSRQEAERWRRALETHTVEDFSSQYVQPWPMPTNPTLLRDTLIVDIGSSSIRAGVLASQATLPQVFIPSVVASGREGRGQIWGMDALAPDVRASSSLTFPVRPTHKISKYSVDLSSISSLLQKAFTDLKVDPKNYHLQLSVPRVLTTTTQAELLRLLFDKFGVRSINLTHQSILALYAYNATSGIVVDVGERMDIVPVIDGYIVDGGVSRVPYGGYRILDHLRQFLYMRNISLINEVESYIIRQVLENICYCAHHYNTEKARCTKNPDNFEKSVSLAEYFSTKDWPYESISLDFGRFQATEGLFNPDAWGLDHPGLHKLVHKAIMECSMDIRKEMSRSIFLAGGVTQLPGLVDRLTTELDNLTPPAIRPKVHASPYRYHAAYIGACVLAESPAFVQSRITLEDWNKHGNATLRKWSL